MDNLCSDKFIPNSFLWHTEEISLGPKAQNTSSDEDKNNETVIIIENEENNDWISWNAFIYQGQTF